MTLVSVGVAQAPGANDPELLVREDADMRSAWAQQWLQSDDPRLIAWGSWLARQDHLTKLAPLLLSQLDRYQPLEEYELQNPGNDRHDALLAVLDALIGLHVSVPPEQAGKLFSEFPSQSLILLIDSDRDTDPQLLEIFERAKANWNWLAAGNVLAKHRTPGFVSAVLSRLTLHLTVNVMGLGAGGFGVGAGASECMGGMEAPKPHWPIVGTYRLTQFPDRFRGSPVLLASGETPVFYWRIVGEYYNPTDDPGSCGDGDRDRYRAQYINAWLAPNPAHLSLEPYQVKFIGWKDKAEYRQELLALVQEQSQRFERAVSLLQQSGSRLTAEEAAEFKPRLEVLIQDMRQDNSAPLPIVLQESDSLRLVQQLSKPLI